MTFNPSISLGDITQVIVILIALMTLVHRMAVMETKVDTMWRYWVKKVREEEHEK